MVAKEKYAYKKFTDRLRKENKDRERDGKKPHGIPSVEQWKSGAYPHGIPAEGEQFPAEIALKGNGEGEGTERELITVPDGTGGMAAKSAADLTKDELWWAGKSLLAQAGIPKPQCGSIVGKLVKDYGDAVVIDAVRAAVVARPADPVEYMKAICMRAVGQRITPNKQEALEQRNSQIAAEWAAQGA
jgi:hypothetical protein